MSANTNISGPLAGRLAARLRRALDGGVRRPAPSARPRLAANRSRSAAGREGGEQLVDAERLEQDVLEAVLPGLDQRVARVVAVAGHQHHLRPRLGLAQAAEGLVAAQVRQA